MILSPIYAFLRLKNRLFNAGFRSAIRPAAISSKYYPAQIYFKLPNGIDEVYIEITADLSKV